MARKITVTIIFTVICLSVIAASDSSYGLSPYDVKAKKVAILPFADYTHLRSFPDALKWGGARRIVAELSEALEECGIGVAPQDAVIDLLLEEGVIKQLKGVDKYGSPEQEVLNNVYSEGETKGIFKKIAFRQEPTAALTRDKIARIADKFGADAVIRGAVFQYELKPNDAVGPFEGFIPFLMYGKSKRVPCYAVAVSYESEFYKPIRSVTSHDYKTEFPLTSDASTIAVEIYIQDAADGRLLWSDHMEMAYPDPSYIWELKKKIGSFVAKLCATPNRGNVYTLE